jgi:hypothetical protein
LGSTLDNARLSVLFYLGALVSGLLTAYPGRESRPGSIRALKLEPP